MDDLYKIIATDYCARDFYATMEFSPFTLHLLIQQKQVCLGCID